MRQLWVQIGWQFKLLVRYRVIIVAMIIAAFYIFIFKVFPILQTDKVLVFLIFSDPATMGFIFVGAIILFEKGDNTLQAQIITPMASQCFLITKALALLIPALIIGLLMVIAAKGREFRIVLFLAGMVLSSLLFTFLGIAGAIRVKSFNQYLVVIPLFLLPSFLPLLNFFGIVHWPILYLIPTHAGLYLLSQSMVTEPSLWYESIAVLYLGLWVIASYLLSKCFFRRTLYS